MDSGIRFGIRGACVAVAVVALACPGLSAQTQASEALQKSAVKKFFAAAAGGSAERIEKAARMVVDLDAVDLALTELDKRTAREIVAGLRLSRSVGRKPSLGTLQSLSRHGSPDVRAEVITMAYLMNVEGALPLIYRAAGDKDDLPRRRAYDGLLRLRPTDQECMDACVRGLRDRDSWVITRSARILGEWPDKDGKKIVSALVGTLTKVQDNAAAPVFAILAKRMGRGVQPHVMKAIGQRRASLAIAAFRVAAGMGLSEAAPKIAQWIRSGDAKATIEAARALGSLKYERAVPDLVSLMRRSRPGKVREAAAVSLRQITGELFGYDLEKWDAYVRQHH